MSQVPIELKWVQKVRESDGRAFEQLFRFYCQPLIHFVCHYVQDVPTAENLVQEVFLAVWANRSRLDPDKNVKTYLYTAARNQALKHLRHNEVEDRSAADVSSALPRQDTPEDELRQKEISTAVARAVAALPEKTRIVFSMNRYDHLTYAEIAQIQGVSIKTVETQMGRALEFLRGRLEGLF